MSENPELIMNTAGAKSGIARQVKEKGLFLLLAAILLTGIYTRFTELAWHFSNVDDRGVAEIILLNRQTGEFGPLPIPKFYTYAPLQFLITPFFISDSQSYRQMLFWGRLPSCVAGILGIILLAVFYRIRDGRLSGKAVIAIALLACSWENIVHAKQMHNYALSVSATIALFILYAYLAARPVLTLRSLLAASVGLAVIANTQYQILAFIPWFYLALFIPRIRSEKSLAQLAGKFAASGILYGALFFPTWFFFLRRLIKENAGVPVGAYGLSGEFLFRLPEHATILENARYAAIFFLKNFFIVFQSNTAFVPEKSIWLWPVSIFLFALFLAGVAAFITSRQSKLKTLGIFFGGVALGWTVLIVLGKLTFGPTRHTLILLPFFVVVIAEGWEWLWTELPPSLAHYETRTATILVAGILALCLAYFPVFLNERRDPFVEEDIVATLEKYKVGIILTNGRSDGLHLMPAVRSYRDKALKQMSDPFETIAWISRSELGIPYERCEDYRGAYNFQLMKKARETGTTEPLASHPCSDYQKVYERKMDSPIQVDFSTRTRVDMYTNGFFFYVFTSDPALKTSTAS
ncbi:MAG: hypothetical protein HYZ83_00060 [Candidatus Omnitrophica bacterium]|nr:hypothetical protein [Candidatus Omnitrophota bacterium]